MYNDIFTNVTNALHFDQIITPDWNESLSAIRDSLSQMPIITPDWNESLSAIRDSLSQLPIITPHWNESLSAIHDSLSQLPTITPDWNESLSAIRDSLSQLPIITPDWNKQLSTIYESIPTAIEFPFIPFDGLNFLKNIDFQQDYIYLTEDDCDSINTILQPSDTSDDDPLKVSKGKISVSDFIKTILISILAILLPMLLTIYYHKIDSIESQKHYIEELQLKEKELQLKEEELRIKEQQLQNDIEQKEILENILINVQSFSEYFESLQEDPECHSAVPKLSDEVPEPFVEVPHSPDNIQDNDLLNPDASKNSETDIHKER